MIIAIGQRNLLQHLSDAESNLLCLPKRCIGFCAEGREVLIAVAPAYAQLVITAWCAGELLVL